MKLLTQIPFSKVAGPIDYDSNLFLLGSCFSEHIGKKLEYFKFQAEQNPFGILFHPLAIENMIVKALHGFRYTENDVFFLNGRYHCFEAHSSLSNGDKAALVSTLNRALAFTYEQLQSASHLIITIGTAWVYRKITDNRAVANCHKVPQANFSKQLLGLQQVVDSLTNCVALVRKNNPSVKIIFTVSPVRHLKDGFVENQVSKAHLIAAVHTVVKEYDCSYFPSYELMMDELRDYRFYERDMIHPNDLAIDYIWEKFQCVWTSDTADVTMKKVDEIQKGLRHRPFSIESEQHQKFRKSLQDKVHELQKEFSFMRFN